MSFDLVTALQLSSKLSFKLLQHTEYPRQAHTLHTSQQPCKDCCHILQGICQAPNHAQLHKLAVVHSKKGTRYSGASVCRFVQMALKLLYERQLGRESRLAHYIENLPGSFDTPLTWADAQVEALQYPNLQQEVCRILKYSTVSSNMLRKRYRVLVVPPPPFLQH